MLRKINGCGTSTEISESNLINDHAFQQLKIVERYPNTIVGKNDPALWTTCAKLFPIDPWSSF